MRPALCVAGLAALVSAGTQSVLAMFAANTLGLSDVSATRLVAAYIVAYSMAGLIAVLIAGTCKVSTFRLQAIGHSLWWGGLALLAIMFACQTNAGVFFSLAIVAIGFGALWSTLSVFFADQSCRR